MHALLPEIWALFRGFPRQKYSSSFNVKKKSNSEIILLGCVRAIRIHSLVQYETTTVVFDRSDCNDFIF